MSKEKEGYSLRSCEQPNSNPQPTAAYPGQSYNTVPQTPYVVQAPVANPGFAAALGFRSVTCPKKSLVEAYLLWLVLGLVGAHHFYLRRPGFGVLYFFTFGLLGCGYLIDLFRMPYLVKQANKRQELPQDGNKKNISDAYTLWFPFGLLGFHHFYLSNPGLGALYFFTLGIGGIGWLVDLFRIPSIVKKKNENADNPPQKSKCTAYLIGVTPFGILGAHHFYLNRPLFGMFYFLTFGNLGIGWLVDLIRMPWLVERTNKAISNGPDKKRYLDDAYLLWFLFGFIGFHHFYLNRPLWGIIYFCTFGLLGIGWLIDGCRMVFLVRDCNKLTEETMKIPTSYTIRPTAGIGYPVVQTPVNPTPYSGYNVPAPEAVPARNPHQPYQYPPQQGPQPSYMGQPPPYSPPKDVPAPEQPPTYTEKA